MRHIYTEDARLDLKTLLSRICNQMWERAMSSDSRQEEELAVNRMMDLYGWAHCVGRAKVKADVEGELISDGDMVTLFLAARDLAGWLLFEQGKGEVQRLWESYGMAGNRGI